MGERDIGLRTIPGPDPGACPDCGYWKRAGMRHVCPAVPEGRVRTVTRDGEPVTQLQCPACGEWGDIDDDQLHGRVSVDHTDEGCAFHETRDWSTTARVGSSDGEQTR